MSVNRCSAIFESWKTNLKSSTNNTRIMNRKWFITFCLSFILTGIMHAQKISASNGVSSPCAICAPPNWSVISGTPDISNRNIVAASGTSGGGQSWTNAPLPLPPNNHLTWITIRDVGTKAGEESIKTTISELMVGRDYEVVIYSLSAMADRGSTKYSPSYIDKYDFQVGTYPRISVTQVNRDTNNNWGTNRLVFTAQNTSMDLSFFPGFNASTSSFESVNISVTLNSINTLPVGKDFFVSAALKDQPVTLNVVENAVEYDEGQFVQNGSVDLDPATPGIQSTYTDAKGTWTVNTSNGQVTFVPTRGFEGQAIIEYTVQDNYVLDGILSPGTSIPKTIIITIPPCTTAVTKENFEVADGVTKTFMMPATDYGFQFDIYSLDNSFQLKINGIDLANEEIDFQPGTGAKQNIRFFDGTKHGEGSISQIYDIEGDSQSPVIRIKIASDGSISLQARKSNADRALYDMELYGIVGGTGSTNVAFNTVTWNNAASNTVIASQHVVGATHMSGNGSGLIKVECPCTKEPKTGINTTITNVAISTNTMIKSNWPANIPNGALVLDSSSKGFVITRINNVLTDIKAPVEGMIAYDETDKCVKLYNGYIWNCLKNSCTNER